MATMARSSACVLLLVLATVHQVSGSGDQLANHGSVRVDDGGNLHLNSAFSGKVFVNGLDLLAEHQRSTAMAIHATRVAVDCPGGTGLTDADVCEGCGFGTYSFPGAGVCIRCPNGTTTNPEELLSGKTNPSHHNARNGCDKHRTDEYCAVRVCRFSLKPATEDSRRPAGHRLVPDISAYEMCPPGMFKPLVDDSGITGARCRYCPRDTYSESFGANSCTPCPNGLHTAKFRGKVQRGERNGPHVCRFSKTDQKYERIHTWKAIPAGRLFVGCAAGSVCSEGEGAVEMSYKDNPTKDDAKARQYTTASSFSYLPEAAFYSPHSTTMESYRKLKGYLIMDQPGDAELMKRLQEGGFCVANSDTIRCRLRVYSSSQPPGSCDAFTLAYYGERCVQTMLMDELNCENDASSNVYDAFACEPCPVGSYTNDITSQLEPGPPVDRLRLVVCVECPAGFFNNRTAQTACQACADGTTTTGTGSTSAEDCSLVVSSPPCPSGHVYVGYNTCRLCPCGTAGGSGSEFGTCSPCPV